MTDGSSALLPKGMDQRSDRIEERDGDQGQDHPHQIILKAEEASWSTFDFLKNTVRKNRMTGIAAMRMAISLYMPV